MVFTMERQHPPAAVYSRGTTEFRLPGLAAPGGGGNRWQGKKSGDAPVKPGHDRIKKAGA